MENDDLLDFQLEEYIAETFPIEAIEDIKKAFELLYAFEVPEVEGDFLNLITSDSYISQTDIQDQFTVVLSSKLDYVVSQHKIKLNDGLPLATKVNILSVLLLVMYLEDYSYILTVLESEETDLEKLCKIISEYSTLSEVVVMESVESIDPSFMKKLKDFAYSKEETAIIDEDESDKEVITNVKLLKELTGIESIGYQLLKGNAKPNLTLENYLALIGEDIPEELTKNIETIAHNVLSLLLLTRSNLNGILMLYRKNFHLLIDDLATVTAVEVKLIEELNRFLDFKRIQKEMAK